jgi:hypothetical protein
MHLCKAVEIYKSPEHLKASAGYNRVDLATGQAAKAIGSYVNSACYDD